MKKIYVLRSMWLCYRKHKTKFWFDVIADYISRNDFSLIELLVASGGITTYG